MKTNIKKSLREQGSLPKSFRNIDERIERLKQIEDEIHLDGRRANAITTALREQARKGRPINLEEIPAARRLAQRGGFLWESILMMYRRLKLDHQQDHHEMEPFTVFPLLSLNT